MSDLKVFDGAASKLYYVMEVTRGVTPDSPALKELRSVSGMPTLAMDPIESSEIGNGREVNDISLGNVNIAGDIVCELSYGSQDDLISGALSSSWTSGYTALGLNVTVDPLLNTYTRDSGDFVAEGVVVGDYVQFPGLVEGTNSAPRFVTAVTPLVITVGGVKEFKPLVAETASTDFIKGDYLEVGNQCQTMTVIAEFEGKCGAANAYLRTTGVEVAGSNINADQNARVNAEFPLLGYDQFVETSLPTGSTIIDASTHRSYSSTDGSVSIDNVSVAAITTLGYSTEDNAAANFTLGSDLSAFVARDRIRNTITASAFAQDFSLVDTYRNKQLIRLDLSLHAEGATIGSMAIATKQTLLTEATPERTEGPVSISLSGQAIGNKDNSSITFYRIAAA